MNLRPILPRIQQGTNSEVPPSLRDQPDDAEDMDYGSEQTDEDEILDVLIVEI